MISLTNREQRIHLFYRLYLTKNFSLENRSSKYRFTRDEFKTIENILESREKIEKIIIENISIEIK
jgi:hypothetical protein